VSTRDRYWDLSPETWTHDEIRDYYDTTNVTLLTLAGMLGMTGSEVKEILMQQKETK
jgi:hypothetical protein